MVNLTKKHTVPGPIIMKKSPGGWDWSLKASHPKLCPGLPVYSKLKPGKRWKNPPLAKDVFTSGVTRLFSKASMAEKDMFWRSRVKLYFRSIGRNWKGIIKMGHVLPHFDLTQKPLLPTWSVRFQRERWARHLRVSSGGRLKHWMGFIVSKTNMKKQLSGPANNSNSYGLWYANHILL